MNRGIVFLGFLALTLGGGLIVGFLNPPGAWYAELDKPWFNPPDWLFAPVWTGLYVLIAVAGWRVWRGGELPASRLWWLQLALNLLWTPLFFTLHWIGAAFILIVLLLAAVLAFVRVTLRRDRVASFCFLPYAGWVAYAALLNGALWWLN